MSWKPGQKSARKKSSWNSGSESQEGPRHRWQNASGSSDFKARHRHRSRNRWAVFTLMAIALVALLIYMLPRNPRTPIVFVVATDYSSPIPINAWAREDREALESLDGKNLEKLEELPGGQHTSEARVELLPNFLDEKRPLIVYVSMHGIVNEKGEPCLVPAGAPFNDSTKWTKVAELLDDIHGKAPSRDTLLILDCNRIRANWGLGIVYNTFVERVRELVDRKCKVEWKKGNEIQNFAVLMSAGPGQINWTSADLQGSVFGHYLQLGLAGAADREAPGDEDDKVSLDELTAYLKREVSEWSQFNRGERQEPILVPEKTKNFRVANAVSYEYQGPANEFDSDKFASDANQFWSKLDELRKGHLGRLAPAALANLEHRLLRWEELSQGGGAYAEQAAELHQELSDLKPEDVLSKAKSALPKLNEVKLHTLPACVHFGLCDAKDSEQIRLIWNKLLSPNASDTLDKIIEVPEVPDRLRKLVPGLGETQFFAALQRQKAMSLWRNDFEWNKVLDLRTKAEQLALPLDASNVSFDERAHYYTAAATEKVDDERRFAEDLLFVGQNAQPQYQKHAQEEEKRIAWAQRINEEATEAFELRDKTLAEVPYLAQWLCNPLSSDVKEREQLRDKLPLLIVNSHKLSKNINSIAQTGDPKFLLPGNSLPFVAETEATQADFERIRDPFDKSIAKLSAAKGGEISDKMDEKEAIPVRSEWRQMEAVLQTPLVTGPDRKNLLANRAEWAKHLSTAYDKAHETHQEQKKEEASQPASLFWKETQKWRSDNTHPLLVILESSPPPSRDDLLWRDEVAGIVRGALAPEHHAKTDAKETDEHGQTVGLFEERERMAATETDYRAKAALSYDHHEDGADKLDPVTELRRFDTVQLLIWHSQRTIRDFWQVQSDPGPPFFLQAAEDYLKAAKQINNAASRSVSALIDSREKMREELLRKSAERVAIKAGEPTRGADGFHISLAVGDAAHQIQYPTTGYAAIFLRNGADRLTVDQDRFVDTSSASEKEPLRFHLARSSDAASSVETVAFFRGRERTETLDLPGNDEFAIDYAPHQYDSQTITLSGTQSLPTSTVFILDCSKSMEEAADRGDKTHDTRLNLAKEKLSQMLRTIASRNEDAHVAICFFGHRVAWLADENQNRVGKEVLIQDNFKPFQGKQGFPEFPNDDVEMRLSIGPFNDTINGQIAPYLQPTGKEALQPWGDTPVYLGLVRSLQELAQEPQDRSKRIVVITDGISTDEIASYTDVVREAKKSHVQVYIVGFDIKPSRLQTPQQIAKAETEFKEIGRYFPVSSGAELIKTLEDRLDTDTYGVPELNREPAKVKLNTTIPVDDSHLGKDLTVSFHSIKKPVILEGGEAIQLHLDGNGQDQRIVAHPYESGVVEANLYNGREEVTKYILRVHQPKYDGKHAAQFPISLQLDPVADPEANYFTKRPVETWVEITPKAQNGARAAQSYVFYDENFEPSEPVPKLSWTVPNWPKFEEASVRFWCKFGRTEGTSIPLNKLLTATQAVTDVPGDNLSADRAANGKEYVLRINERHVGSQSPDVYEQRIRLELDPALKIKPTRIIHTFDRQQKSATHSYFFPKEKQQSIEQSQKSQVVVTSAKDLKDGAHHIKGDLSVSVLPPAVVIPQSATNKGR